MGTYSTIQTRVTRRVIDLPSQVTAEVPTLVNEALRRIQNEHNFKVMEGLLEATTTLQTRVLAAMPPDFKEFRARPWYQRDDGSVWRMEIASKREDIWPDIQVDDENSPLLLVDGAPDSTGARNFEVWPLPDGNSDYTNGEYRIKVPYWRFLPALVNANDTNWFTVNAEEYLVNKATSEAFALDWDEERMGIYLQKAQIDKQTVINTDKRYRVSGVVAFVPHWRGQNDSNLRW